MDNVKPYSYEVGHWMVQNEAGNITISIGTQILTEVGKKEAVPLKWGTVDALRETADRLIATAIAMNKQAESLLTGIE